VLQDLKTADDSQLETYKKMDPEQTHGSSLSVDNQYK
jgi:hypothetical protein